MAAICGPFVSLTAKHGIRNTLRLSLRGGLHQLLTSRRSGNHAVRRTIGNAFEGVCDTGQLECNLVGSARLFQHHDAFSAEVKSRPKHETNYEGHNGHEYVMTCDGDAPAGDSNQAVREQSLLFPAGR